MALVLGDLYRALRAAGADDDTAMAAAHEAYLATRPLGSLQSTERLADLAGFPRDAATHLLVYMLGIATGLMATVVLLR